MHFLVQASMTACSDIAKLESFGCSLALHMIDDDA